MKYIFIIILFSVSFYSNHKHAYADNKNLQEKTCSSYKAEYVPKYSMPREDNNEYSLRVEKIPHALAGQPYAKFLIDTWEKDRTVLLSTMQLTHKCTGSGAIRCFVSFDEEEKSADNSIIKHNIVDLSVIGLNNDFSVNPHAASSPWPDSKDIAPYALIIPHLTQIIATTNWLYINDNIKYFTPEKIHPEILPEVWLLSNCKK